MIASSSSSSSSSSFIRNLKKATSHDSSALFVVAIAYAILSISQCSAFVLPSRRSSSSSSSSIAKCPRSSTDIGQSYHRLGSTDSDGVRSSVLKTKLKRANNDSTIVVSHASSRSTNDDDDYDDEETRHHNDDDNSPTTTTSTTSKRLSPGPINPNPYNIPQDPDEKWEFFYSLLVDFYNKHNHTNIEPGPQANQSLLRNWMAEQRKSYMKTLGLLLHEEDDYYYCQNVEPLPISKKQRLDDAGFHWGHFGAIDMDTITERQLRVAMQVDAQRDEDWIPMLERLKSFRIQKGHVDVPIDYEEDSKLAKWVYKQRRLKHVMSNKRKALLDRLGFNWFMPQSETTSTTTTTTTRRRVLWSERLEQLKRYKTQHGHCDVPIDYEDNPKLGEWVSKQRRAYKLWNEGKKAPINENRIRMLDQLGFRWTGDG